MLAFARTTAKTKAAPKNKPTQEEIRLAKLILKRWGDHSGPITDQGLRALQEAVRTLKQAYG
jgi:hypothetical protein